MKRIELFLTAVVMVVGMAGCNPSGYSEDDFIHYGVGFHMSGAGKPAAGQWSGSAEGVDCMGTSVNPSLTMTVLANGAVVHFSASPPLKGCDQSNWSGEFTSTTSASGTWKFKSGGGGGSFSMTKQ